MEGGEGTRGVRWGFSRRKAKVRGREGGRDPDKAKKKNRKKVGVQGQTHAFLG